MAKFHDNITPALKEFIEHQKIFFVGTAAESGRVNVSPKGTDSLRVVGNNKVVWLNLTGSGNETAAHLLQVNRMTIMFCAFEGKPNILRLYGTAQTLHQRDALFREYYSLFESNVGARQIFIMDVDTVQTSCGFAVPFMDYVEDRSTLNDWSRKQGAKRIKEYWKNKNTESIDGFETKVLGDSDK